jgi:DNA segregation ATPase FtsK/SpoIIIE, S-DNA-T family
MAKTKKSTAETLSKWHFTKQHEIILGVVLILAGIGLFLSFTSFFIYGNQDQSTIYDFFDRIDTAQNWLGKIGAWLAHIFIFNGFGVASYIWIRLLLLSGLYLVFDISKARLKKIWFWDLYTMILLSVFLGFFAEKYPLLGGTVGFEVNHLMRDFLGSSGTVLFLLLNGLLFAIFKFNITPEKCKIAYLKIKEYISSEIASDKNSADSFAGANTNKNTPTQLDSETNLNESSTLEETSVISVFEKNTKNLKPTITNSSDIDLNPKTTIKSENFTEEAPHDLIIDSNNDFVIEKIEEEASVEENLSNKLVQDFGEFDPTLELSKYKFPTIDLLKDYAVGGITINQEELEENKNRILETLKNYKIEIAQIKATVGPSVTLYEIVPEAGIRISKIKSLEDDIALSLSALGIRIIAPIPGKGTIGIEVPNKNPSMVSMRSVISSPKFQTAEMELPIALGKTISNETFVVDLAKMPHLLMAGATGQGKSVGLNAVLTSLLYKKHPAEVKFVLVDPKKVELTLFNKIERHYLAKLPDTEDAIITDNTKVIHTLNSLCTEMDNRYGLLKDAMVRNIKEYNEKFKLRKLNPENGHRFLPYIVLVVDEFADLIMTAGKEVETPIARLAQLARAIGIHLIIATQRPSVNVITGIIKANFPARIAFRVTSKIDSRTILDTQGADQLIGRGDLLYTNGNDLVRVQCAFVDTPEVERITEYIGNQRAYPNAYLLPEYIGEDGGGTTIDVDISERDSLFKEAAEIIVTAQQGSASLLQRKLKLGYNRAGRIIDQLEAAGIVGPFEGAKARSVLISDLVTLDQILENEKNNS